jgi:L-iditol 2-dehydrogenase
VFQQEVAEVIAARFVGKEQFEVADIAAPSCPVDGLLVRVHACAICGTDLKILKGADVKQEKGKLRSMELPRVTGHEFSGTIEEAGAEIKGYEKGERVVVAPSVPCTECIYCRRGDYEMCDHLRVVGYDWDGGFSELVRIEPEVVRGGCVLNVPDGVNMDEAALAEPLSCALNCLGLSPVRSDGFAVILGAGPLGCFITELVRLNGARKVVMADVSATQLDSARLCAADMYVDASKSSFVEDILSMNNGYGADLVVTACPSGEAQSVALRIVAKKGYVNFFGGLPRNRSVVPLDTNLIHYKECHVVGTHGSTPGHVRAAVGLIESKKIDFRKYITNEFALVDINEAFRRAQEGSRLKILVKPGR